ncbi:MAG: enoyl-CoA hydratase [Alphaproteobacteria bacterium]|nr:enoyl-CoA hydratase [Alphaproteobacteria bacterium]
MSSEPLVLIDLEERTDGLGEPGTVATITVNNARRANSLNSALMRAFADAVTRLAADPSLRCAVVTGAGERSFMAGADLHELTSLDPEKARAFLTLVHGMSRVLRALPVPVIGRINGACFGAGMEVAAACDMRVAAASAVFGMPEVRLGLPSVVEAALFPQLIGWGRTRQLVYTGETITAKVAAEWGFVETVVPATQLDAAVEAMVVPIVASGPRAIRLQKELVRDWEQLGVGDAIQAGIRSIARAYESDEPRRMLRPLIERLKNREK